MKIKKKKITYIRWLLILTFIFTWEYTARNNFYNVLFTSYPSEILKDLKSFYSSGDLVLHASITLKEAFYGLLYGSLIGITVGLVLGQVKVLGDILLPIITAINGVPQLTLAPIYILWFGLGLASKIFLSSIMVFFNVFFATYAGVNNIEPKLLEASELLGSSKIRTLIHVIFPSSMPWVFSGIRMGIGSSLVGAIIGEYIGSSKGFGWMISYATSYFNVARVMSCILILLIVGILLNNLLNYIEKHVLKWRLEKNNLGG